MKRANGITLMELLIVVAIIGILASFIYPSYQSYMIKVRRSDAQTELITAQLKQSSLHILHPYSNVAASVGLPTADDYYTFSIVSAGVSSYLMKAVAKSGTTQVKDKAVCQALFIDQNNNHTHDGSISNEQCW